MSIMAQLKKVVEPFGEVNVYPAPNNKSRVVATILMEPHREGTQTGIALDGSGSMANLYGAGDDGGDFFSTLFGTSKPKVNDITPVAQKLCAYLARKIDADGGTTVIYWAVGPGGSQIQEIGDLRAEEAERHVFGPPDNFGTGTQLLPALRYFADRYKSAPFGFYVFITDGELHDLEAVKAYTTQLAREIAANRRNLLKCILIGVGQHINESQMEELDDLDTGTEIDVWDHKLAAELRHLSDIFAEVVDRNARLADHGRILDNHGRVLRDYAGRGLPAQLEFEVPLDAEYFTLEVNGVRVHQGLFDQARVPPREKIQAAPAPAKPQQPSPPPAQPRTPPPPRPAEVTPSGPPEDWQQIELEMAEGDQPRPEDDKDITLDRTDN
jgi:hypothetical protein